MEWHRITTPAPGSGRAAWDRTHGEPLEGEPSDDELRALASVLSKFTDTPEPCWFCSWTGFGVSIALQLVGEEKVDAVNHSEPERGAEVALPGREYFLSSGLLADVTSFEHPPNLWWPDDKAWCVASEVDLLATYVGGSRDCIQAVLEPAALEAVPVSAEHRVDSEADTINSA